MTRDLIMVTEHASLEEAARLMERHHIKRLPVVRDEKLIGIVTRANLMQAIATREHAWSEGRQEQNNLNRTNVWTVADLRARHEA